MGSSSSLWWEKYEWKIQYCPLLTVWLSHKVQLLCHFGIFQKAFLSAHFVITDPSFHLHRVKSSSLPGWLSNPMFHLPGPMHSSSPALQFGGWRTTPTDSLKESKVKKLITFSLSRVKIFCIGAFFFCSYFTKDVCLCSSMWHRSLTFFFWVISVLVSGWCWPCRMSFGFSFHSKILEVFQKYMC